MTSKEFEIKNESGLHTRPGNLLVKTAKKFDCKISITKSDNTFSAKSLLKLMKANITKGDKITVSCDGTDETEAIKELILCLDSLED